MDRKLVAPTPVKVDMCPVMATANIIGKKWYLIILHELTRGPMGFNELKRAVRGISLAEGGLAGDEAYWRIQGLNPDGTVNPAHEPLLDAGSLIEAVKLAIELASAAASST